MRRPNAAACVVAALIALGLASAVASAQTLDDKLRAELSSVLGQLHDLQNNQASLEAAKAAAERERDALKARLARAGGPSRQAVSPAARGELSAEKAKEAQLGDTLQSAQADLAKYKDALQQAEQAAQQARAERDHLAAEGDTGSRALADCETKNIQLIGIGREILVSYSRIGVPQALARGEPFVGLERAKLERAAQAYGDRVYGAKFDARLVRPSATGAKPADSH